MLNRNFDIALIGRNFLSLAHSCNHLRKGKRVLLLDDDRFAFGNLFTNNFGIIEKKFMQSWGAMDQIGPLALIEMYTQSQNLTLIVNGIRLQLGGSPFNNLRELCRKWPNFFPSMEGITDSEIEFNRKILKSSLRIANEALFYKAKNGLTVKSFYNHCPPELLKIFKSFHQAYIDCLQSEDDDAKWLHQTWVYLCRGYFHSNFNLEISELELFHLFYSIISPQYVLDSKKLEEDLHTHFIKNGGQSKNAEINNWHFSKNRPWSLELSSYEGIVHPKNIALVGTPNIPPVLIHPFPQSYRCVNYKFNFFTPLKSQWVGERILATSTENVNGQVALWYAHFTGDHVLLKAFVPYKDGAKEDFYKKSIQEHILPQLNQSYPGLFNQTYDVELAFDHEVVLAPQKRIKSRKFKSPKSFKAGPIVDISSMHGPRKIKNIRSFGPHLGSDLGLLSSLMDISDHRVFFN